MDSGISKLSTLTFNFLIHWSKIKVNLKTFYITPDKTGNLHCDIPNLRRKIVGRDASTSWLECKRAPVSVEILRKDQPTVKNTLSCVFLASDNLSKISCSPGTFIRVWQFQPKYCFHLLPWLSRCLLFPNPLTM